MHETSSTMSAPPALVIATRNPKKAREMQTLLVPPWEPDPVLARLEVLSLDHLKPVPEVVEDGDSFAANARKKAAQTAQHLGRWVVADDSGLAVDALAGAPGVYSARYAGTHGDDAANNRKLLEALAEVPDEQRGAAFVCALALADPDGSIVAEVEAQCRGRITRELRGTGGFGYDPLFLIPEYHKTFGELSPLVKNQISHRARAFARLRPIVHRLVAEGRLG
jgi:XTP/dITP diphosphohydrolase